MSDPASQAGRNGPEAPPISECRLLLVDRDDVSRRYLELALTSTGRFRVEVAGDASGALDILGHTIVDLVICDVDSSTEIAFSMLKRVRREPRWRTLPLFFVGASGDVAKRVSAFQQGVDDVIAKPLAVPELTARIDAVMRRVRLARSKWRGRRYELAGNFRGLSFSDLVSILENGQRSGQLSVLTRRGGGSLFFDEGRIRHANYSTLQGPEAIYRLFAEPEGEFEFLSGRAEQEVPQTVSGSATGLLLEAARRMDQGSNQPNFGEERVLNMALASDLIGGIGLTSERIRIIQNAISDPFNLGELALLRSEELATFISDGQALGAVQVILTAPLDAGALALSSLAAPLSEGQVSKCLLRSARALTFTFDAGESCCLNVVLVDPEAPLEAFGERWPPCAALILAPSGGDWMSFSISSRVALTELLAQCQPLLVDGLGNDNFSNTLSEVLMQSSPGSELNNRNLQINDADFDFRGVIVNVLESLARQVAATEHFARRA
jgi:DNA-binding response OmpR family regulator